MRLLGTRQPGLVTTYQAVQPLRRQPTESRRTAAFVREFLRDPLTTASLVPSSKALASAMIPSDRWFPVVLELGPGTGAFSRALQQQSRPPARHLGIELNPTMSSLLSTDYPEMEVVIADATAITDVLAAEGLTGQADLIVSGLPWQAFAGPAGAGLIPSIAAALRPDGVFTQFTYSWTRWAPPGRRQRANLRASFGSVEVTGPVWVNVPPATVYTCRDPLPLTGIG